MRRVAVLALLLTALDAGRAFAAASVSLTLDKENTVRVTSAAVQGGTGAFPAHRLYYIRASTTVFSATTADGLALTEENGVRLSSLTVPTIDVAITSITGLSLMSLTGGGFRMAYSVQGTTGCFNIYTATSADGLAWANDTGTAIVGGTTFAGYPSLVKLNSGNWAMFFTGNVVAGSNPVNRQVFEAQSSNEGRNWGAASVAVAQQAGEVSATKLTDGRVRLWYTGPSVGGSSNTVVYSAISDNVNATSFSVEPGVRLSTTPGTILSPFVERSTETSASRWRLYYDYSPIGLSTGDAFSAVTDAPQPKSVTPSVGLTNQTASVSTLSGEIFTKTNAGGLPTAVLSQGALNLAGAGVAWTDDETLTATFATQGQPTGFYDLTITNPNGQSTKLLNAFFLDFPGGSVTLTDNLFRPRNGGSLRVDVTNYVAGRVVAKLYTLDGRFISTLFDGSVTAGTTTFRWNGTTPTGATVASGVYLVRVTGPKLDAMNKVVVIK